MRTRILIFILMITVLSAGGNAIEIGEKAPGFHLPGVDGKFHRLTDYKGRKAIAVIFTCNHCPFAKAYQDRIIRLQKDYRDRGVQVLAINPNNAEKYEADSFANMKKRAADKSFNFPYLRDRVQQIASAYDARVTPDVFLLDKDLVLRYRGRIDDAPWKPGKVKSRDLRNAINALLAGKEISKKEAPARGCSIKWTHPGEDLQVQYYPAPAPEKVSPIRKGDIVPNPILADGEGRVVRLREEMNGKPTVLIVYRGGWCPFCTRHLAALSSVCPDLEKDGWKIIALSPDLPVGVKKTQKNKAFEYTLLSDPAMEGILALGLGFSVARETVEKYKKHQLALRSQPGTDQKVLPVPAVLLINSQGKIVFVHTNPDYKKRLSPEKILRAARAEQ